MSNDSTIIPKNFPKTPPNCPPYKTYNTDVQIPRNDVVIISNTSSS
jgi:hypothetical protein